MKRLKDRKHLEFVSKMPCCCCGMLGVQVHHLLRADPKRGMGRKADDKFAVPLCPRHHRELHSDGNEERFLRAHNVNGKQLAEILWRSSKL